MAQKNGRKNLKPLLTQRSAIIFLMAFVVAAVVATLNQVSTHDTATSIVLALLTFGGTVLFGAKVVG